jgi:hypothetical protein
MDARSDAKSARNKLELLERHEQGPAGDAALQAKEDAVLLQQMQQKTGRAAVTLPPTPVSPPVAAAPPPAAAANTKDLLFRSPHVSSDSLNAVPPPLTPQQRRVREAPAIGKVSEYQHQYGFVVVTAGANRKLEKDMAFALRHEGSIVGRIKITEVDQNSAVGDLDVRSVPQGVTIEVGVDVIQDLPEE